MTRHRALAWFFVIGGKTGETSYKDLEPATIRRAGAKIGSELARGGAHLLICSLFDDSIDLSAAHEYLETEGSTFLHIFYPQEESVQSRIRQLEKRFETQRDKISKFDYPAPEALPVRDDMGEPSSPGDPPGRSVNFKR